MWRSWRLHLVAISSPSRRVGRLACALFFHDAIHSTVNLHGPRHTCGHYHPIDHPSPVATRVAHSPAAAPAATSRLTGQREDSRQRTQECAWRGPAGADPVTLLSTVVEARPYVIYIFSPRCGRVGIPTAGAAVRNFLYLSPIYRRGIRRVYLYAIYV